jgi:hypothetical protein
MTRGLNPLTKTFTVGEWVASARESGPPGVGALLV